MIYNPGQASEAFKEVQRILDNGKRVKIEQTKETRSARQNRALHLFFTHLALELNKNGVEYKIDVPVIGEFRAPFDTELVKKNIWYPIQLIMYGTSSTTELTTKQINEILDILTLHYGNAGIEVHFPSQFDLYLLALSNQNEI